MRSRWHQETVPSPTGGRRGRLRGWRGGDEGDGRDGGVERGRGWRGGWMERKGLEGVVEGWREGGEEGWKGVGVEGRRGGGVEGGG